MLFDSRVIAERKIQEAMEEGAFDNIPGKGRPLNLEEDAHIPAHLRAALRILKNADVAPEWIQMDKDIRKRQAEAKALWALLEKEYPRRKSRAEAGDENAKRHFAEWLGRTRSRYMKLLRQINSDILTFNILAPSTQAAHIPRKLEEASARLEAAFPPLAGIEPTTAETEDERESKMRAAALELYKARLRR